MTPNSSSFRPSLHPIAESPDCSFHLTPGKDATDRDARDLNTNALSRRPRPDPPPSAPWRRLPSKRYAAPLEHFRLMMADVPTSPRLEAEQPATASLSSSLQHQKAARGSSPGADAPSATAADPAPDADTTATAEPETEPVAPKLDPAGFFTLVSNATTNSTHHPTVKYIFLDDDPDALTAALAAHHAANQAVPTPSASTSKPAAPGGKNPPQSAANRAVLLDVVPGADGQWKVASAASLSADFAVTDASIARQEGAREGGLVLKIEGVESEGAGAGGDKDKDRAESLPSSSSAVARSGGEEYGPLLEDFERKMGVLRRVVKAGEGRAEKAREKKLASDDAEPKMDAEE
ncbi:hypothetical protein LZ32DRAFT_630272 [Colletotrichum eremochloae]|nr:hypothetical protein LZ32DRAFT_630272 [Colletotrichum eremochloae]